MGTALRALIGVSPFQFVLAPQNIVFEDLALNAVCVIRAFFRVIDLFRVQPADRARQLALSFARLKRALA
jgi:hypothetical protein